MKSETPKMYVRYIYDGTKDDEDAVAYFKRWVPQVDVVQFTLRLPVLKGENAIQVQKTEEYSDVPELFSSGSGKVPCGAIGSFSSDGTLTPCSSGMGEKQLALGNLKEKSFRQLSEKYVKGVEKLKRVHDRGKMELLPDPCKSCFAIVDGGNNCQDFDILLMMTVASTVSKSLQRAIELKKDITC